VRHATLQDMSLVSLGGEPIAAVAPGNPLAIQPGEAAAGLPDAPVVIAWSGGLGEDLFSRDPRTWLPPGRAALERWLDAALPEMERRGGRLLIRPHARHVVSDAHAAVSLLDARAGAPLGLALDPAALLEASMLGDLDDHLVRTLALAGPRAEVIVLGSVRHPADPDDESPLAAAPLGEGLIDASRLGALALEHAREGAVFAAVEGGRGGGGPSAEAQLGLAGIGAGIGA